MADSPLWLGRGDQSPAEDFMTTRSDKVRRFRELHGDGCFTIPNPWDIAGARMMTGLGFKALATTSSGYAFSKGKRDMTRDVDRDETLNTQPQSRHRLSCRSRRIPKIATPTRPMA